MVEKLDVDKLLRRVKARFTSGAFYDPGSDAFQFYQEDVDHFAERRDCWLTVYKSFDDERLVGFKIKNVKVLLSRFDALGLEYRVSKSGKKWHIQLQALIAYIPTVESQSDPLYHEILRSFGKRLAAPLDMVPA